MLICKASAPLRSAAIAHSRDFSVSQKGEFQRESDSFSDLLIETRSLARAHSLLPSQLYLLCRSSRSLHSFFLILTWPHCPSQERPSVNIFTSLPPLSGFTKIVSVASPRFRLRIEDCAWTISTPSLVQPCALRFAASSAQTLFTLDLLLKRTCSTIALYSTSVASFVSARSFAFNPAAFG